jgi:hypothetical protein
LKRLMVDQLRMSWNSILSWLREPRPPFLSLLLLGVLALPARAVEVRDVLGAVHVAGKYTFTRPFAA